MIEGLTNLLAEDKIIAAVLLYMFASDFLSRKWNKEREDRAEERDRKRDEILHNNCTKINDLEKDHVILENRVCNLEKK